LLNFFTTARERHVIEQYHVGTRRRDRLLGIFRFDNNRKRTRTARFLEKLPYRIRAAFRTRGHGRADMIVLDEDRVVQAEAVVRTATFPDRVLVEQAVMRNRLARIKNFRARPGYGVRETPSKSRNTAEALEQVQRNSLGGQYRGEIASDFCNPVARGISLTFRENGCKLEAGIHGQENHFRKRQACKNSVAPCHEKACACRTFRNRNRGSRVSRADVFFQSIGNEALKKSFHVAEGVRGGSQRG
jgi:hypothetical protein